MIGIFRNDPEVIKVGVVALRYQLISLPLNAFILVSNMLAQTCRKPWRANFLAAARQGLFFVPLMIILPNMWGLLGVEICQSVSDVFRLSLQCLLSTTLLKNLSVKIWLYKQQAVIIKEKITNNIRNTFYTYTKAKATIFLLLMQAS